MTSQFPGRRSICLDKSGGVWERLDNSGGRMTRLCKLGDLPEHLRFNPHILSGYRPPTSTRGCVRSLLYYHNESFNIYSHCERCGGGAGGGVEGVERGGGEWGWVRVEGVDGYILGVAIYTQMYTHWTASQPTPACLPPIIHTCTLGLTFLYFLLASRDYLAVWPQHTSLVTVFISIDFVCSVLPFLLSVLYHTFMCHHSGERTYRRLLKSDVFGVWLVCTFGPISTLYTGLYFLPVLRLIYLLLYMLISLVVLYYLLVVDCKRQRVAALTAQFVFRVSVHFVRLSPSLSPAPREALKYLITMDVMSAVGGLINALHVPERWLPSRLNYVCNGHSLMHVVAFLSLAVGRQGFLIDMKWLNSGATCTQSV